MILALAGLACIAWYLTYRGLRRLSRRIYFKGACTAVEQISDYLGQAGIDNTWVVGQDDAGVIRVMPMEQQDKSKAN